MALCSDHPVITPELVEFARFGKWHDLENGVFNDLANQWGTLKHIFFHKTKAIQSMNSDSIYLPYCHPPLQVPKSD